MTVLDTNEQETSRWVPDGSVERYHELLTDEVAADSWADLERQMEARGLFFGDRPLCTVLRPRWLAPRQYDWLRERAVLILRAFDKAHRAAVADPRVLDQFRLDDWERPLAVLDPGFRVASPLGRLDAFFVDGGRGLRFTEYNAETPAGAGYNDAFTEVFLGLPVVRAFLREYEMRPLPVRHSTANALVDTFQEWRGARERPRVAILDWREVPTYSEFVLFEQYFRSQGIDCVIADPREVEYRNGRLTAGDFHVTLIYKRVLISELVQQMGVDNPVVRAVRDRAVCMVNPFACKILHKKASLAVLGDERNAHLFDADEREAVEAHVPWTRVVEERRTTFRGRPVDLVPFIRDHRDHLVLKPNDEYGGKGIVLGWEVTDAEWTTALRTALAEPYIVQDRIHLPSEPYPTFADGRVHVLDRMYDTAPYTFHGAYMDGCLTRLATTTLLNVTAGGGSNVPTFVVQKR